MQLIDFEKLKFPDRPGVYFFRSGKKENSEILYIGKATSLRDRVRSYFSDDLIKTRGPAIVDMVTKSKIITFKELGSVLEALIFESSQIKKYQPKYNTKEKDDRSYYKVVVTEEKFPRILIVREKELQTKKLKYKIKKQFGPFPNSNQLEEALKIIRKIFPFFDTKKPIDKLTDKEKKQLSLNISIGLCPDVFNGLVTLKEYQQTIRNICLFFLGKKKKIIQDLKRQMRKLSNEQKFEQANLVKKQIFALSHINDVSLIKKNEKNYENFRIEAFDIAHTMGESSVGVMIVIKDGNMIKNDYKKFILRQTQKGDDCGGLQEILIRRFNHLEWALPDLIVVDGGKGQKNIATKTLKQIFSKQNRQIKIPIVSVIKDNKHIAKKILGSKKIVDKNKTIILKSNIEAHRFAINFHRQKMRKRILM